MIMLHINTVGAEARGLARSLSSELCRVVILCDIWNMLVPVGSVVL